MKKNDIWTLVLTVLKYAITLIIGWLGGNGIQSLM